MSSKVYDVGDAILLKVTFKVGGVETDPTTVTLKVKTPSAVSASYVYGTAPEVTREGAGVYVGAIPLTEGGNWVYRWEGTGTAPGAEPGGFSVRASEF